MTQNKKSSEIINQLSYKSIAKSIAILFFASLGIIVLIKMFVVDIAKVESASMEPTLKKGDYVVVSKIAYDFLGLPYMNISKNDIVAFKHSDGDVYIKRVFATAKDTVYYNESFVQIGNTNNNNEINSSLYRNAILYNNEYFLIGDNFNSSFDSRYIGKVKKERIIGKPIFVYWSENKNRTFTFLK